MQAEPLPAAGLTVADIAARYRVSPDRIRGWIRSGTLPALDTTLGRGPRRRWVVPLAVLLEWEARQLRASGPTPRPQRRRRQTVRDYYPDDQPAAPPGAGIQQ